MSIKMSKIFGHEYTQRHKKLINVYTLCSQNNIISGKIDKNEIIQRNQYA